MLDKVVTVIQNVFLVRFFALFLTWDNITWKELLALIGLSICLQVYKEGKTTSVTMKHAHVSQNACNMLTLHETEVYLNWNLMVVKSYLT